MKELKKGSFTIKAHKGLFTSTEYYDFLDKKIAGICKDWKQYKSDLIVTYTDGPETACTDSFTVRLNAGCDLFLGSTLKECFLLQNGAVFHEMGHRLFTMFGGMENLYAAMESGNFYPSRPEIPEHEDDILALEDFMKNPQNAKLLTYLVRSLANVIEDGRIETILLSYLTKYTNMYVGLKLLRKKTYEQAPSYAQICQQVESGQLHPFLAMQQLVLYYGRFGQLKEDEASVCEDALLTKFEAIRDDLNICLDATEEIPYFQAFSRILCLLAKDILSYIEQQKEEVQKQASGESSQEKNEGKKQGQSNPFAGQKPLSQEALKEVLTKLEKEQEKIAGTTTAPCGKNLAEKKQEEANAKIRARKKAGQGKGQEKKDADRPEYVTNFDLPASSASGAYTTLDEYIEKTSLQDLSWIAKVITDREADEALEEKIVKDLSAFTKKVDFTKAHRGVSAAFVRHKVTDSNRKAYEAIREKVEKIASAMAKKSDNFQDPDMRQPVLRYAGKRFCASEVYKANYKYFASDLIPQEAPKLLVALVIDESGSMGGAKIKYARQMALVTYLYCKKIGAKILTIGHSTGSIDEQNIRSEGDGSVCIFCYSDFAREDENDKYRIMNIQARGCNRDGYALRYAKQRLAEEAGDQKLLMIVSDGSPNHGSYRGTVAAEDLREVTKECEKENIALLAAAIDSDKDTIRAIYGREHFLDITNLETLPVLLTQKIKMFYQ